MRIFKILEQYKNAIVDLESLEDIDEQCIKDTLESLELEIDEKIINTAAYIKNLNHSVDAIDGAIKELNDRKYRMNKVENILKSYIKDYMELSGKDKINSSLFDVYIKENPSSVDIFDEKFLIEDDNYDRFIKRKTMTSYDKIAIKNYLKSGGNITGVRLVKSKRVVIK